MVVNKAIGDCPVCGRPYYAISETHTEIMYIHDLVTTSGGLYIERTKGCTVKKPQNRKATNKK